MQNIVITMAGRGSRFYAAGYKVPKYEIVAHDRSLFEWSMRSLKNFLSEESRIFFVCLAENRSTDYVRAECARLGIEGVVEFLELNTITDGQATSAYVCRDAWEQEAPLLIYNIDTYVNPRALRPTDIREGSQGWVPCFKAPGDHWSFVKLNDNGWAADVVEKQRISENASVGLYWFAKAGDYVTAYQDYYARPEHLVNGERYVAPLYRELLRRGGKISIVDLPVEDVHVLGTPAELDVFITKDKAILLSEG
ncbi:glycosyltransferase family 2 protein [Cupriavidus necator]|uniref:MobA-like NTP transferase domain-containing protein n=1 Tax=Cupriavidus pinatubonensis (strain JMP 134 / LMG 1197) TaxID=264198 RepID=Q474R9_CUPPJ|nr:glycosyltransferase family 2 protein [Cupriavidus necator]